MSTVANATFGFTSWDENSYNELDGELKLTMASITNDFKGDVEGSSTLEYLMVYLPDGSASFTGHERVIGSIGDRRGSFILKHDGVFANRAAQGSLTIIPGSATGDLAGLTGSGSYTATHEQPTPFTLEYEL